MVSSANLSPDLASLRDELERWALSAAGGKRTSRGLVEFNCPFHADTGRNGWLRDFAFGCHVCGEAVGTGRLVDLARAFGITPPPSASGTSRGYTVQDYADEFSFRADLLERWGVANLTSEKGASVVGIPCRRPDGTLARTRCRGRGRRKWWHSDGEGLYACGLDVLTRAIERGGIAPDAPLLVVEGESDTHAAWHLGIAAVGIPGANAWREEWGKILCRWPGQIYLWQEPGKGGAAFLRGVAPWLRRVKVLVGESFGQKDLAAMRLALGEEEARRVLEDQMLRAAPPGRAPQRVLYTPLLGLALEGLKARQQAPVEAVPTPFPMWNEVCRGRGGRVGLALGWYVLIGGLSGFGKTLLANNLANAAILAGEGVAFHSLEMGWDELAIRQMAILSGEPIYRLEPGSLFDADSFDRAAARFNETHEETGGSLYLNAEPLSALQDLLDSMDYHFEVHGCRVHVIDYLQLAWLKDASTMLQQITEVSHAIRAKAKKHGVLVVALSQLNRETTAARTETPRKEGLLGGSPLENDSEQVVLLDHSRQTYGEHGSWIGWQILDKNRHGPLITPPHRPGIPIRYDSATCRIEERLPDEILATEVEEKPKIGRRRS